MSEEEAATPGTPPEEEGGEPEAAKPDAAAAEAEALAEVEVLTTLSTFIHTELHGLSCFDLFVMDTLWWVLGKRRSSKTKPASAYNRGSLCCVVA